MNDNVTHLLHTEESFANIFRLREIDVSNLNLGFDAKDLFL